MGRTPAVIWHASSSIIAAALYFLFVLPRWWELMGVISQPLGTALRIVSAVLIALAALPVVFTWLRTRRPEYGIPRLALALRVVSIVAHVTAGVLIAGTAISEIWLSLDRFGQWLFGVYGAAAAIALLGIAAFYLSFVAELPPPPPKPLKPKKAKEPKQRRGLFKKRKEEDEESTDEADSPDDTDADVEEGAEGDSSDESDDTDDATATDATQTTEAAEADEPDGADESAPADTANDETAEDEGESTAKASEPASTESDAGDTELVSTGSRARHKLRPSGKRRTKNDS